MHEPSERCADCGKPRSICVCDRTEPLETRLRVLVLQHPQENDAELGTVPILRRALGQCTVEVGLSWASLAHALGAPADPQRWAVIFPAKTKLDLEEEPLASKPVVVLDRHGALRPPNAPRLEGLVVLDGTWSQAKTLWWRNPWLLKLSTVHVRPSEPSIYGRMRREPRREYVSTLEAVADTLVALGEEDAVRAKLRALMRTMVQRARDAARPS